MASMIDDYFEEYIKLCRENDLCVRPECENTGFPYCEGHDAP